MEVDVVGLLVVPWNWIPLNHVNDMLLFLSPTRGGVDIGRMAAPEGTSTE